MEVEVDEIEIQRQVAKFQRVSSNGSTTTTDNNSSNPQRLASNGAGDAVRVCGWPSSRIVRVSRASGGKDRHSKVLTSKGLRDRRVRLSVNTAIQFYDLQDRLGYDQPSKAVEWLLKAAASSIDELPSLDPPFLGSISDEKKPVLKTGSKSPTCSSTSETSKGSGLSLSRSENRNKARERAREMVANKEKEKDIDSARVLNQVNNFQEGSSFTDLLTGRSAMDYIYTRPAQPPSQFIQIPQFNITSGDNNNPNLNPNPNHQQQHHHHQHFSFLQESFVPAVTTTAGGGGSYNLNFGMTSSEAATGGVAAASGAGYSRGTLQSNLQSLLPHQHHLSSDGSTSTNLPFFVVPNAAVDHYPVAGGYHFSYGGDGGGRRADHHKEKSKN